MLLTPFVCGLCKIGINQFQMFVPPYGYEAAEFLFVCETIEIFFWTQLPLSWHKHTILAIGIRILSIGITIFAN
jgi:hypothetical protein